MTRASPAAAPVSPFLAALGVVLPYAAGNLSQLELPQIALVTVLALGSALVLTLLLRWYVGGFARAAICATIIIYVCFTLPQAVSAGTLPDLASDALWLVAIPALVWLVVTVRRTSGDHRFVHLVLNGVLAALLVIPVLQLVRNAPTLTAGRAAAADLFPDLPPPTGAVADAKMQPDIWHIVMDRYAGMETLAGIYNFDNTPFLDALRQRGFAVADRAHSNYPRTAHSLASTLNLDYLDGMSRDPHLFRADFIPIYRAIYDSRAARFFDAAGYHMVQVASWWEATRRDRHEDENLGYRLMPDFIRLVLEKSIFGWALSKAGIADGRIDQCHRLNHQFDAMAARVADPRPKRVFAHILLPHPPFVMDEKGHCKPEEVAERETRRDNYIDQVIHANDELIALIDRIAAGARPAVILLHADEGPWPEALAGDETELGGDVTQADWSVATPTQLREKLGILLAVKGVAPGDLTLAPDATPVNLYRQVLNRYFGYALPLLPERSHVYRDRANLYDFIDVSDVLR